jgi:hypothetical protein
MSSAPSVSGPAELPSSSRTIVNHSSHLASDSIQTSPPSIGRSELRTIQHAYSTFVEIFSLFAQKNGPAISGAYMANSFIHLKSAFEQFLLHTSHYFSSLLSHSVTPRRYSPLLKFSAKLLREWAIFVSTMNRLSDAPLLPHLHQFQDNFENLSASISMLCETQLANVYRPERLFGASNLIKHEITSTYQQIYDILSHEFREGFARRDLVALHRRAAALSRSVHDNFLYLLPLKVSSTPAVSRTIAGIRTSCGTIIELLDSAFHYRSRLKVLLIQMSVLHRAICSMLDRLAIRYDMQICPREFDSTLIDEPVQKVVKPPTTVDTLETFVSEVSEMLNLKLQQPDDPVDKLDVIEMEVMKVLSPARIAKTMEAPRSPRSKKTASFRRSTTSHLSASVWQKRTSALKNRKTSSKIVE